MKLVEHRARMWAALGLAGWACCAAPSADAVGRNEPAATLSPHITVTGTGLVRFKPDIAVITVFLATYDPKAQIAVRRNIDLAQTARNAAQHEGVLEKDIQSVRYTIKKEAPSFVVLNYLQVTVRTPDRLPSVIDALDAVKGEATSAIAVESISSGRADADNYERQALEAAYADARRKAEVLANASGNSLNGVLEIREDIAGKSARKATASEGEASADSAPALDGDLTMTAQVTVVYQIDGRLASRVPAGAKTARKTTARPLRTAHR